MQEEFRNGTAGRGILRRMKCILLILAGWVVLPPLYGQELVPTMHFDQSVGTPFKVLYNICKDRDGFVWLSAQNGVFRFDGKSFYPYTTKEGLCDNEIVEIFADSRGRIWCAGYNGQVSVIENGVVSTRYEALKNWEAKGFTYQIVEDREGNIYFAIEKSQILKLDTAGRLTDLHYEDTPGVLSQTRLVAMYDNRLYTMGVYRIYRHEGDGKFARFEYDGRVPSWDSVFVSSPNSAIWITAGNGLKNVFTGRYMRLGEFSKKRITMVTQVDRRFVVVGFFNEGTIVYDLDTDTFESVTLPLHTRIVDAVRDDQGNIWLSAYGDGLYAVRPQQDVRHKHRPVPGFSGNIINAFKDENRLFSVSYEGQLTVSENGKTTKIDLPFGKELYAPLIENVTIKKKHDTLLVHTNMGLFVYKDGRVLPMGYWGKDFLVYRDSVLFIRGSYMIFITKAERQRFVNSQSLSPEEVAFRQRAFAQCIQGDRLWIGSMEGLRYYDIPKRRLGDILYSVPANGRIETILPRGRNGLIVGTSNSGLLFFNRNGLHRTLTTADGMLDNDCKEVDSCSRGWIVRHALGLSLVDVWSGKVHTVSRWAGIPVSQVNNVGVFGDTVLLSTRIGLFSTDVAGLFLQPGDTRRVGFIRVTAGSGLLTPENIVLGYDDNKLKVNFAIPEYGQPDLVQYAWRINDAEWNKSNFPALELADLQPGKYLLQVKARAPGFGWTAASELRFVVKAPFWKTWLFIITLSVCMVLLCWLILHRRYRSKLAAAQEKATIRHRLLSFEQKALNAMMNPHFIFNAMGSIQYLLNKGNNEQANDYLVKFSRLIRKTLETTQVEYCPLPEEIDRISLYLQLEKMRFDGLMDYEITVDENVETETIKIPTLILQTYLENAVIHGSGNATKNVFIRVVFGTEAESLRVCIEDNGPGFDAQSEARRRRRFGLQATETRLGLLSRISGKVYDVDILSPLSPEGGTRVALRFPLIP